MGRSDRQAINEGQGQGYGIQRTGARGDGACQEDRSIKVAAAAEPAAHRSPERPGRPDHANMQRVFTRSRLGVLEGCPGRTARRGLVLVSRRGLRISGPETCGNIWLSSPFGGDSSGPKAAILLLSGWFLAIRPTSKVARSLQAS